VLASRSHRRPFSFSNLHLTLLLVSVLTILAGAWGERAAAAEADPDLVAAYSFDEGAGSVAHDSVGTHDGDFKNGTVWTSAGKYGGAVNFDGVDDLITVPAAADLNLSKNFTIEAWVKPDALTPYDSAVTKEAGSSKTFSLIPEGDHVAPKFEVAKTATSLNTINATSQLPLSTWSHVALTFNGETLRLYVNGSQVATVPQSTLYNAEGPLQIGGNLIDGEYFDGSVDEIRLYNRTLSATEVKADGEAAVGWNPQSRLVAAYSFDESSGTVAHDAAGAHDGALEKGTVWTTGKYGGAVSFDGLDDVITVPAAADIIPSKNFTVETWVKPDVLTPYDTVLAKEAGSFHTFSLIPEGNHVAPKAEVANSATGNNTINATSQLPLNTWSHLALTSDANYLRLYVNGVQAASVPNSSYVYTAEGPLVIGSYDGEYFDGAADDVRIYNRTLSAAEVKADKEAPLGGEWPSTTVDFGAEGLIGYNQPEFGYGSNDPEAKFECRFDAAAYVACEEDEFIPSSPLADGAHSFSVRAVDAGGHADATPATRSFTVDATAPTATVTGGPTGPTAGSTPTFTFSAAGGTVTCAIRNEAAEAATPVYGACSTGSSHTVGSALADGPYSFLVRVTDSAGTETLAARNFTVDTVVPQTTIISAPSTTTDDAKASFGFTSSESGTSFSCRFDSAAFAPCSGPGATHAPTTALSDGFHAFEVRAADSAGNLDSTPAKQTFTVKTTGPQTSILSAPSRAISVTGAKFTYSANKTATFECKLDAAAFAACGSSKEYTGLAEGAHSFEVRAVASLVADPTPARRDFIVDTSLPSVPAVSGALKSSGAGMTLDVEAKDGDPSTAAGTRSGVGQIRVKVDGKVVATTSAPCEGGACAASAARTIQLPYQEVVGTHQLAVEAQDGVGHFSPAVEWTETASSSQELLARRKGPKPPNCPTPRYPVTSDHETIRGSECADRITVLGAGEHTVYALGGDDIILASPGADTINAGEGNDFIRSRRSSDTVYGEAGNDVVYGGTGDDTLYGGPEADLLDGGPGGDGMVGEDGDDTIRGGQGEGWFTGGNGTDTFSFSDAVTPGFSGSVPGGFPGFPGSEAGILINLSATGPYTGTAANGPIQQGGQQDFLNDDPERVVGSAFADYIIGTGGNERIDGGPGGDYINGAGGVDEIVSDSSDYKAGDPEKQFGGRKSGLIEIGIYGSGADSSLYMAGSSGADLVNIRRESDAVQFVAQTSTVAGHFNPVKPCTRSGRTVTCPLNGATLGPIIAYGAGGNDELAFANEQAAKSGAFSLLGGNGVDEVRGGEIEDLLVDGRRQGGGLEHLRGGAGDDALLQGSRADVIVGGSDNDLLISATLCVPREAIYGDETTGINEGSDNSQFHFFTRRGVNGNLMTEKVGEVGGNCNGGNLETLSRVDILEGSEKGDIFKGNERSNYLLGRGGRDAMRGEGGVDKLHAIDEAEDKEVDCGAPKHGDIAQIDEKSSSNDIKITAKNCEIVKEDAHPYTARPWVSLLGDEGAEAPFSAEETSPPALEDYYRLNELGSGTSADNDTSEGTDGTYKAVGVGPSVNGPGPSLGASGSLVAAGGETGVAFDGVDDFVDLGEEAVPDGGSSGAFSVAFLAKFDKVPGAKEFIFSSGDATGGAFLYRDAAGKIVFSSGLEAGAPEVTSAVPINDSKWHHFAGTLEGETITLFVDGFPYSLGYGSSVMPHVDGGDLAQVAASPSRTQLLDGTVDEVMTYEGTLDEAEVAAQIAESKAEEPEYLLAPAPEADGDGDGVLDGEDNCPTVSNASQADTDVNGIGDACNAPDADADGIFDSADNCPSIYNPSQADTDGNGMGDECASMPPTVETEPASSLTGTGATFNAKIDPEGLATTYRFEYGTTTAYGLVVPAVAKSAGSGISPSLFAEAVTGLAGATTYHYRVVATNEAGQSIGADQVFKTP
jgi:Ca2+-binding RTX toxin-like protein